MLPSTVKFPLISVFPLTSKSQLTKTLQNEASPTTVRFPDISASPPTERLPDKSKLPEASPPPPPPAAPFSPIYLKNEKCGPSVAVK